MYKGIKDRLPIYNINADCELKRASKDEGPMTEH